MELLERYEKLKRKVIERKDSFDRFLALLEGETTWLTSPASIRYHLAEERGLLKHSVGVAETLLRFREAFAPVIPEESCVIVGLFHDT
jgi:23S rRNA maturation-related 3'-5' exoribonuclease YhaM